MNERERERHRERERGREREGGREREREREREADPLARITRTSIVFFFSTIFTFFTTPPKP